MGSRGIEPPPQEGAEAAYREVAVEVRRRLSQQIRVASPTWLTRAADFEAVRREGKRIRTRTLEVRSVASLRRLTRIGIIVPRYQHSAVDRNLLKRRLREILRRECQEALAQLDVHDVVVRATPSAYASDFATLRSELTQLARRLPAPRA